MNFLDAAYHVLQSTGETLHYREITRRALAQGLIQTKGKTPEATMRAQLGTSVKQATESGPPSPFCHVGRGMWGLAEWEEMTPAVPEASVSTPPAELERQYLSYKEAAVQVLEEAGQPLHYGEIARRAVESGTLSPAVSPASPATTPAADSAPLQSRIRPGTRGYAPPAPPSGPRPPGAGSTPSGARRVRITSPTASAPLPPTPHPSAPGVSSSSSPS